MRFAAAALTALILGVAGPAAAQMPAAPPGEMPDSYGGPPW